MKHVPVVVRTACLALGLLVLAGCGSSPTPKFYTLHSVAAKATDQAPAGPQTEQPAPAAPAVIGIGPVEIPDYLDRPQLVTRSEQNRMRLLEFDLWTGSLRADVSRVLMEDLYAVLPPDRFSVVWWKQGAAMDYRVAVHIHRFDAGPGEVLLSAQWTLFTKEKKGAPLMATSRITEASGADPGETVAAMSRALARLSREIAQKVQGSALREPGVKD
jgi:hypothetical protein